MLHCYHCGHPYSETLVSRQDTCDKCGKDVRVCRNCRHFDKSANNECREEQAPRQVEKEKSNFCEWFQANTGAVKGANAPTKNDLKSASDALFKKK